MAASVEACSNLEIAKPHRRLSFAVTPFIWFATALLHMVWNRLNAFTARQARRYQIRAYLFG